MIFQFANNKIAKRSASLFCGALIISTFIFVAPDMALSQDARFVGEYYCVETASGGVIYDQVLKDWRSATFQPGEGRILVKVSAIGESVSNAPLEAPAGYKISVSSPGDPTYDCLQVTGNKPFSIGDDGIAYCTIFLQDYRFNFKDLRYMQIYAHGFYRGEDDTNDTPYISVGECSKF